jgi:hypothetical protein
MEDYKTPLSRIRSGVYFFVVLFTICFWVVFPNQGNSLDWESFLLMLPSLSRDPNASQKALEGYKLGLEMRRQKEIEEQKKGDKYIDKTENPDGKMWIKMNKEQKIIYLAGFYWGSQNIVKTNIPKEDSFFDSVDAKKAETYEKLAAMLIMQADPAPNTPDGIKFKEMVFRSLYGTEEPVQKKTFTDLEVFLIIEKIKKNMNISLSKSLRRYALTGLDPNQFLESIDLFYTNSRNLSIRIHDIFYVVNKQLNGASKEEIEAVLKWLISKSDKSFKETKDIYYVGKNGEHMFATFP